MKMRRYLIIAIILFLSSCQTQSLVQSKQFELVEAYSRGFVAGFQNENGGNSGVYYILRFEEKGDFKFTNCWIDGTSINFEVHPRGDLAELSFVKYSDKEDNLHPEIKMPIEHEGIILLEYEVRGKKQYYSIKNIERKATNVGV